MTHGLEQPAEPEPERGPIAGETGTWAVERVEHGQGVEGLGRDQRAVAGGRSGLGPIEEAASLGTGPASAAQSAEMTEMLDARWCRRRRRVLLAVRVSELTFERDAQIGRLALLGLDRRAGRRAVTLAPS